VIAGGGSAHDAADGGSMPLKLMTVDDSATIRRIVASCASELAPGVEVIEAENGQRCLELIREQRPDIIILDINMPVMNGEDCLDRLKADPLTATIPIVMLTTESEKRLVLRFLRKGIAQFIVKPFTRDEFRDKVGSIVEKLGIPAPHAAMPLMPAGDYILVIEDKPRAVEQLQAGCPEDWSFVPTPDPQVALRTFQVRAPIAVIANLNLGSDAVFDMFAQMRRTAERQGVRYIGACLRTSDDLIGLARAHGYLELLLKPFDTDEISRLLASCRQATVRATVSGDVCVIHAARGRFVEQADALLLAMDKAAEEGFLKVLVDVGPVEQAEQEQPTMWRLMAEHAAALGIHAAYVTPIESVRHWLSETATTGEVAVSGEVTEGLAGLAA
jgi:two-component system, chemotaxis family, chemotaxis protein CheY